MSKHLSLFLQSRHPVSGVGCLREQSLARSLPVRGCCEHNVQVTRSRFQEFVSDLCRFEDEFSADFTVLSVAGGGCSASLASPSPHNSMATSFGVLWRNRCRGSDVKSLGNRRCALWRARWQRNPTVGGSSPVSPSCTTWMIRREAVRTTRGRTAPSTSATAATPRRATGAAGAPVCITSWARGETSGGHLTRRSACGWTACGSFSRCSSSSGTWVLTYGSRSTTTSSRTTSGVDSHCSSCWCRRCWSRS